jgi:4-amino-4-deoxy-L-arabinose transferase-like glycosyltransferase
VLAIAAAQLALLLATSGRYGYDRDELYFIVAGGHAALGYPDQPPIVPLVCWAMHRLAPGSLLALRFPSALVSAVTTALAAVVAREIGGGARAQVIAAACTAVSAFALAVGHFVTTTTFDLLSTTLVLLLLVRGVLRRSGPSFLLAGIVVGIGVEAKPQVGFVAAVVVVALVALGPRWPIRSPWLWGGIAAAAVIAAPYIVWQALHGFPQLTVARNIGGSAEGGRAGFIPFQLVMVSPLLVPVWIAGLAAPFRRDELRPLRFVPLAFGLNALAYLAGNGKAYYLASAYPVLLGIGAIPVAAWTLRRRGALRTGLLAGAIVVSGAVSAVIALPLLPERSLQGSAVMALNPDQGETVGWPRFVDTIARAWNGLPTVERTHTAIFTENYGEAGAVDVLGASRGLPRAYSGHNAFGEWGEPPPSDTDALVIGYDSGADAAPSFHDCTRLATIDDGVGLDNDEQGLPVLECRPAASWAVLWPRLRHYN